MEKTLELILKELKEINKGIQIIASNSNPRVINVQVNDKGQDLGTKSRDALERLTRGDSTINEIRAELGLGPVSAKGANEHYITKE